MGTLEDHTFSSVAGVGAGYSRARNRWLSRRFRWGEAIGWVGCAAVDMIANCFDFEIKPITVTTAGAFTLVGAMTAVYTSYAHADMV